MPPRPELSIIIPAFNEADRLPAYLHSILGFITSLNISHEIIVVDDGSSDNTSQVAASFGKICSTLKVVRHPINTGKGQAVKTGMNNASGHLRLFTDADGSTPITELTKFLQAIREGADAAVGSRVLSSPDCAIKARWYRKWIGGIFRTIVYLLTVRNIRDTQCGFKLFTEKCAESVFSRQKLTGFGFDVEILYLCNLYAFKITEIPVNWNHTPGSKIHLLKDSLRMFIDIVKIRYYVLTKAYPATPHTP